MFYFMLLMGAGVFIFGYLKNRKERTNFGAYYQQINDQEKELKLVNHTLEEENLKIEIDELQLEVQQLRGLLKTYTTRENENKSVSGQSLKQDTEKNDVSIYRDFIKKFQGADDETIDELSKELEIGKGELLLLKNLSRK